MDSRSFRAAPALSPTAPKRRTARQEAPAAVPQPKGFTPLQEAGFRTIRARLAKRRKKSA